MYSKISKNCTFCKFVAISTSYTSKESIFHIKLKKQKKYGLFENRTEHAVQSYAAPEVILKMKILSNINVIDEY